MSAKSELRHHIADSLLAQHPYSIEVALDSVAKAKPSDIQEVAASQIKLLNSYYTLVLEQAKRSFRWALIAAGVGLLFFLGAVGFILVSQLYDAGVFSLISGALVQVIAGINFYLYGRTSAQLATFHDKLEQTQRFLLANSVCEGLADQFRQHARSRLIDAIIALNSHEALLPGHDADINPVAAEGAEGASHLQSS
jgi:hypothetical protein